MMCARVMAAPLLILGLALFSADRAEAQQQGVWVVKSSPHSVPVTVEKLTSAIERAGASVAAVVDHAAGAKKTGMDLPPTTLVIFGNPKLGTPLMQETGGLASTCRCACASARKAAGPGSAV